MRESCHQIKIWSGCWSWWQYCWNWCQWNTLAKILRSPIWSNHRLFKVLRSAGLRGCSYSCTFRRRSVQVIWHEAQRHGLCWHLQRRTRHQIYNVVSCQSERLITGCQLRAIFTQDESIRYYNRLNQIWVWVERWEWSKDAEGHINCKEKILKFTNNCQHILRSPCNSKRKNISLTNQRCHIISNTCCRKGNKIERNLGCIHWRFLWEKLFWKWVKHRNHGGWQKNRLSSKLPWGLT